MTNFHGFRPERNETWRPELYDLGVIGGSSSPDQRLTHGLEVNAFTLNSPAGPELTATWSWAPSQLSRDSVRRLSKQWFDIIKVMTEYKMPAGHANLTPSDFPLLKLIQPEIDTLAVEYPSIEDILPLSPLQEGMLFRNILDSEGPDNYTVQLVLDLAGPLDPAALREAGNALFRRHANFRAGFYHKGDVQPVQVIQKQVFPAWRDVDLTAVSGAERALSQEKLLAAERAQRVDLSRPPLTRFLLVKLEADRHLFAMTSHHILLDGWSLHIVLAEFLTLYGRKGQLKSRRPFRDYLAWIARQDHDAARKAWRATLAGLEAPALLGAGELVAAGSAPLRLTQNAVVIDDGGACPTGAPAGADLEHDRASCLGGPARQDHAIKGRRFRCCRVGQAT